MASAIQAPADAAGPTSHTQNQPGAVLPAASARLLQQIAAHDHGDGVLFDRRGRGLFQHPNTGAVFAERTFRPLGAQHLIRFGGTAHDPVRITDAGRARAAALTSGRSV
jgi:hypothetical protein